MPGSILLVGSRSDTHLMLVAAELRRRGYGPLALFPGDLPKHATLSVRLDGRAWTATARTPDSTVDLRGVRTVFARNPDDFQTDDQLADADRTYAYSETRATVRGIWNLLGNRSGCVWMNHPSRVKQGSLKVVQLRHASRAGIRVPKTVVTTDPDAARGFRAECGGRTLATLLSKPASADHATTLALATMERHDVPIMLQEQVLSIRTLRVIVVDRRTFTGTVLPDAPGDADLPPQIAQRCVELIHSFGLRYAAIDLAVTPDGDHVFLELNPEGPFLDTDAVLPTTAIVHAIADTLIHAATEPVAADGEQGVDGAPVAAAALDGR